MARSSRKNQAAATIRSSDEIPLIYRTAIYARLSVEDNGKENGDSLENQIELLEEYVRNRPYLTKTALFVDNGFTGTDFLRPEFGRMMQEAQAGKIDCVVVKDLSRLGRNYIETGNFIEKVFPFLKLRFIAINDNYDTAHLDSSVELGASLKNIINDYYAKDISRKSGSALKVKRLRGDFIGNYAPHGYLKDPENKNHLLIDPEVAPAIQHIFELRAEGTGIDTITRILNAEGYPSPGRLRFERGIITNNNKKGSDLRWNRHVTKDILLNVAYIGHLAQGRSASCYHKGVPFHWTSPEEWDVVEHTHEPIISLELWEKVQAINSGRQNSYQRNYGKYEHLPKCNNAYGKKLICADCGAVIKLVRSIARGGAKAYFNFKCPTQIEHGDAGCPKKNIRQAELDEAVLQSIKKQMELFMDTRRVLNGLIEREKKKAKGKSDMNRIAELKKEIKRKKSLSTNLYTDMKDGLLSEEEYRYAKEKYKAEVLAIQRELKELENISQKSVSASFGERRWSNLIDTYYHAKELSAEMVDAFIEEIRLFSDNSIEVRFKYLNEFEELFKECARLKKEVA
ncbi:MAG: recombinase family protein [Oscillospiraceae bacterium]|nr:recombinase family protein [Oscillospiraceae bacterium]